jgi:hypothetical protein
MAPVRVWPLSASVRSAKLTYKKVREIVALAPCDPHPAARRPVLTSSHATNVGGGCITALPGRADDRG